MEAYNYVVSYLIIFHAMTTDVNPPNNALCYFIFDFQKSFKIKVLYMYLKGYFHALNSCFYYVLLKAVQGFQEHHLEFLQWLTALSLASNKGEQKKKKMQTIWKLIYN